MINRKMKFAAMAIAAILAGSNTAAVPCSAATEQYSLENICKGTMETNIVFRIPSIPTAPVIPDMLAIPTAPVIPDIPSIPTAPVIPVIPEMPTAPVIPDIPAIPTAPVIPEIPVIPAPVIPDIPEIPTVPVIPDIPAIPTAPVIPDIPPIPTAPVIPEIPVIPAPVIPDIPEIPTIPVIPDIPAIPTTPADSPTLLDAGDLISKIVNPLTGDIIETYSNPTEQAITTNIICLRKDAPDTITVTRPLGTDTTVTGDGDSFYCDVGYYGNSISEVNLPDGYSSSLKITLKNSSMMFGKINENNMIQNVSLTLDNTSKWIVEGTSYLSVLTDEDATLSNIVDNGNTIYYNSSYEANSWLGGKTYTLSGGGKLIPLDNF